MTSPEEHLSNFSGPPEESIYGHTESDYTGRPSSIFISYSRTDYEITKWIRTQIEKRGFRVLQDISDTMPGEDWWERIKELILQADQIVFLLSTKSILSKICIQEVEYATSLNKRIFPVVIEKVDWQKAPKGLSRVQSIYLGVGIRQEKAMQDLIKAMETDLPWIREHTRLQGVAQHWKDNAESPDYLLIGDALQEAKKWMSDSKHTPKPTSLQHRFIDASRELELEQEKEKLRKSEEQRKLVNEQRYESNYNLARLLEERVGQDIEHHNYAKAWLNTLTALNQEIGENFHLPILLGRFLNLELRKKAFRSLWISPGIIFSNQRTVAISNDDKLVASACQTIRVWSLESGEEIVTFEGHREIVNSIDFSPDMELIVSAGETIRLWSFRLKKEIAVFTGHSEIINSVKFSPDGKTIVSASNDHSIRL